MNEDIMIDELELTIMNQQAMQKSIEIEIKKLQNRIADYEKSHSGLIDKIAENQKQLADLKNTLLAKDSSK